MEYRKLGKSEVMVSPIVMGCWSVGGDYFGSVEDENSIRCIQTYLEHGVNTFDTAEIYGNGRAEKVLGEALKGTGSGREAAIRALQANGLEVTSIKDVTPVPHNGCRPPKCRRV